MRHKWRHKSNPWSKFDGHPRSKFEGHSEWKRETCQCWEPRRCDMEKNCIKEETYAIFNNQTSARSVPRRPISLVNNAKTPNISTPAARPTHTTHTIRHMVVSWSSSLPKRCQHQAMLVDIMWWWCGARRWWAPVMEPINQMRKVLDKKLWDQPHQKREGKWWRKISVCMSRGWLGRLHTGIGSWWAAGWV